MRKQRILFTFGAFLAFVFVFHMFAFFIQTDVSSTVYLLLVLASSVMCGTFVYAGMVWQQILNGIEDIRNVEQMKETLEEVEANNEES